MKVTMESQESNMVLSSDPANTRRHQSGNGDVKCATDHVIVSDQAIDEKNANDRLKSARKPHRVGIWNVRGQEQEIYFI